jgi:hypothetical protein
MDRGLIGWPNHSWPLVFKNKFIFKCFKFSFSANRPHVHLNNTQVYETDEQLLEALNELEHFEKCKQLLESQNYLFLGDIWWSKF